jgi:hypothetical protein
VSRPSALGALKKLTQQPFDLENGLGDLAKELWKASDRAAALMWCSVVEDNLREWLVKNMRSLSPTDQDKLFYGYGPLSSFSARINVSFAFYFIGERTRRNMDHIRAIRNAFAHTGAPLSFDTPEMANVCRLLDMSYPKDKADEQKPRLNYETTCFQIAGRLYNVVRGREPSSLP